MSTLSQRISEEMKTAFLGGDRFRGDVLRNLKAAILNEEVAKGKREEGLSDAEIELIIAREVKKRAESARLYSENNRPELAEPEVKESAVLEEFLPKKMTDDELRDLVAAKITEMGASGPQAMGQVIGAVKAEAGTAADGAKLAQIVKEILVKS